MKIEYKQGSLLEAPERYLVHGCNAQKKMASGIAKLIREKYPEAFDAYEKTYELQGKLDLGQAIFVNCHDGKIVINAITQKFYGREPNTIYVSYEAIREAVRRINRFVREPVAFPQIGAGLGGGDWQLISQIIEEEATNFQPIVYIL